MFAGANQGQITHKSQLSAWETLSRKKCLRKLNFAESDGQQTQKLPAAQFELVKHTFSGPTDPGVVLFLLHHCSFNQPSNDFSGGTTEISPAHVTHHSNGTHDHFPETCIGRRRDRVIEGDDMCDRWVEMRARRIFKDLENTSRFKTLYPSFLFS